MASILTEKILDELSEARLTRINLSIGALDPKLSKEIADTEWFDIRKIVEIAHQVVLNTKINLLIAPVWVPGVNDTEIPQIIELAKSFQIRLVLNPKDFGIHKRVTLLIPYRKFEPVKVKVVEPGWLKREN